MDRFIEIIRKLHELGSVFKEILDKLREFVLAYLIGAMSVVGIAWLLNVLGRRDLIYFIILAAIPASLVVLVNLRLVVPFVMLELLRLKTKTTSSNWNTLVEIVANFLFVISSITYTAIWPLILLTYFDFSQAPLSFLQIVMPLYGICIFEQLSGSRRKIISNFLIFATPQKLLLQFLTTLMKFMGVADFLLSMLAELIII